MAQIAASFNPVAQSTDETEILRAKLKANGWHWVPGLGKGIYYDGWNKGVYDSGAAEWAASENPEWNSTGILQDQTVARDVDAKIPSTAAKLAKATVLGESPCGTRYGSKGSAMLYGVIAPMRSITVRGIAPGDNKKSTIVEYIGMTRQLMCFGIHPDTRKPYRWEGKSPLDVPVSAFTKNARQDFIEQAKSDKAIALADGWTEVTITLQATDADKQEARAGNGGLVSMPMLAKMLSHVDPGQDHNDCLRIVAALKHAEACELVDDSDFSAEEVADKWSRGDYQNDKQAPANYADGWAKKRYDSLDAFKEGGVKFATLVHAARTGGYKGPSRIDSPLDEADGRDSELPQDVRNVLYPEQFQRNDLPDVIQQGEFIPYGRLYNPWNEYDSPVFPLETFPPAMRDFAVNIAANKGGDVSAMAMCCLAAISMALGHDNVLYLMPDNTFSVRPAIWVMLRGDSGTTKTWLERPAVEPLQELDNKWQAEYRAAIEVIEKDDGLTKEAKETALAEIKRPRRLLAYDATTEALMDILSHQNSGIGIFKDELIGLILGGAKYGGDSAGISNRADLLQAHDGGPYVQDRIKRGTITVQNYSVSILGGIQPNRLSKFKNLGDDGLLQRFLPVIMKDSVLPLEHPDNSASHAWRKLIERLATSTPLDRQLSKEARAEFRRLQERIHKLKKTFRDMDAFASFIGKLEGTWGSLALLLHMAWECPTVNRVSLETARRASRIVEDFLFHHGHILYRSMGEDVQKGDKSIARVIVEALQDPEKAGKVKWRDFYRGTECCRAEDVKPVQRLRGFTGSGWLVPDSEFDHCREWTINPAVAGFATEAKEERRLYDEMLAAIKLKAANKKKLVEGPED